MYQYSFVQWLAFFYFYCFFGWCFESTYVSLKSRKLVNRGFMRGPFLPLYGSGAIMMLVVSMPFQDNLVLTYIAGVIGATALEYVTGVCMEGLFKVRYWDYSNQPFNFQGHICLGSSLAWGGLTILMTHVIHKPVEGVIFSIPMRLLLLMVFILTIFIVVDLTLSFKAALDIREILVQMEKAKEEMVHMQKRLDVIIAIGAEAKEEMIEELENRVSIWKENRDFKKEEKAQHTEELLRSIEERLESLKYSLKEKHPERLENLRDEINELRQKFAVVRATRVHLKGFNNFYKRDMLRSNPTMISVKFKEALEELKEAANEKKSK